MMLQEKQIEAIVAQAIQAANVPASIVVGAWVTAPQGVKNLEHANADTTFEVSAGIRQYQTAQIPTAEVPVTIAVSTLESADPTGEKFAAAASAVTEIMQGWQDDFAAADTTFSFDGFALTAFRMDGGSAPVRDGQAWTVTISATIGGVFTTPTQTKGS
jgi:hypothetical protein